MLGVPGSYCERPPLDRVCGYMQPRPLQGLELVRSSRTYMSSFAQYASTDYKESVYMV